jgi:hypothetical protein
MPAEQAPLWTRGITRRLTVMSGWVKHLIISERARRRKIFRDIYKNNVLGTDENHKYFSGH